MPHEITDEQVANALYCNLVELRAVAHSKIELTQGTCNGHADPVWFPARLREDEAATDGWNHIREHHVPGVMAALPGLAALLAAQDPGPAKRAEFLVEQVNSVRQAIAVFVRDAKPVDAILFLTEVASTLELAVRTATRPAPLGAGLPRQRHRDMQAAKS